MFSKLDNILLITFFIFILTLSWFLWYSYLKVKDIKIEKKIVYDEIIQENYIPYKNKTFDNLKESLNKITKEILSLKNDTITYNKELKFSTRMRLEYFDFYAKYKKEIKFIEYLARQGVYLTDFEKKIFLKRLNKNKKIENALDINIYENIINTYLARVKIFWKYEEETQKNNEIKLDTNNDNEDKINNKEKQSEVTVDSVNKVNINDVLYSKNKKQIIFHYDKLKKRVKIIIEKTDEKDNEIKRQTIYVWKLDFFNIINEYIYDIKYIDDFNNNRTIGVIHSLWNDFKLKLHFFEIEYKRKGWIYRIINIDNYNNFIWKYNDPQCHYLLKYLTIVDNKMKVFCYNYNLNKIIEKTILVSEK